MNHLGVRVKNLRKTMEWSQEDLAREIGVSLSTVQRWETRGGKPIRLARAGLERLFRKTGNENGGRVVAIGQWRR